jgi:hypothetical protein
MVILSISKFTNSIVARKSRCVCICQLGMVCVYVSAVMFVAGVRPDGPTHVRSACAMTNKKSRALQSSGPSLVFLRG